MLTDRLGRRGRFSRSHSRGILSKAGTAPALSARETFTGKLAKFFPQATPVRIPVQLTRLASPGKNSSESTVIEFGTSREVLFASNLPLEFADKLRLQNLDGTLDAEAYVVALQYNPDRTVVAARFKQPLAGWIVKS